jgi:hypothetical protein
MTSRRGTRNLGRALPRTTLIVVAAVVVLLVVVDVALVALALARTSPEQHGPAGPIPTFTSTPDASVPASPSSSATPAPSASADNASTVTAGRNLLSALDGTEAWRASSGSCSADGPVLEHTTDGGATWQQATLGADVRAISALRVSTDGLSVLAEIGDDCTSTVQTSVDGGATWTDGADGAAGAGITPEGIVLRTATEAAPCSDPVDAFQGERTTVVVCDGQVEWRMGVQPWVDLPLGGVRSIAVDGSEYTLARIGTASCAGVQIETMPAIDVTASTSTTPVGCATDADPATQVSIDRVGDSVWLWSGDDVKVSADGGATW